MIYMYLYTQISRERGRIRTVEIVLFDISNSMKPYSSAFRAPTSKLRPAIGLFEASKLDEVSNRIPPTSQIANSPEDPQGLLFRADPLIQIGQTAPCRAIRGSSISVNSTLQLLENGPAGQPGLVGAAPET